MKFLVTSLVIMIASYTSGPLATYKTDEAKSSLKIEGTSTMHDWEIKADGMDGTMEVDIYDDSIDIKALKLRVPVKSLKSGKGPMDANTHKALKANDHPYITYELSKINKMTAAGNGIINLVTEGRLTVAGQTRTLSIPIKAKVLQHGIELSGTTSFRMTQFKVEPPSFMFGSVTTGDDITIHFNINYH